MKISKGFDEGKLNLSKFKTKTSIEFIGRTQENNGVKGYVEKIHNSEPNDTNVISVSQIGTVIAQIRNNNWYSSQNIFILTPNNKRFISLFVLASINKTIFGNFSNGYSNYPTLEKLKNIVIKLPITANGEIDFDFMESFIAELEAERVRELEAYLKASGLSDTTLSPDEKSALNTWNSRIWQEFKFKDIFNNIKQGRRVKKDDQIDGDIPFIMSGITNTGFVKNISNPIEIYPKNSITIDIFGNTFYRNYVYGAGDDTGIYWNDMKDYSKLVMLFFATSMAKSVYGKFDFGKKLRSSQSLDFTMKLPITTNGEIDFDFMESFIKAIQKECIKGVDSYLSKNIATTKEVINN